jgi:hypothetical protein
MRISWEGGCAVAIRGRVVVVDDDDVVVVVVVMIDDGCGCGGG